MQNIHQWTYIFCFYEGLHFKCTLIAALWTILCDDFHVFLQTENLAFCTFPLHFYWHIYRGLNSIFSKWRKTEEGSRNCTSITVTCVISTSWDCCPNNDYHVTILTYVSCDDKQTIQCTVCSYKLSRINLLFGPLNCSKSNFNPVHVFLHFNSFFLVVLKLNFA